MSESIVNSTATLASTQAMLRQLFERDRYLKVTVVSGKKRSLDQNALARAWAKQISLTLGDTTPDEAHAQNKLMIGVPILRADSEDFAQQYDSLIKGRFTYEEKLKLMDWFPVTSLMNKRQLSQYLENVQQHYAGRVPLEFPAE